MIRPILAALILTSCAPEPLPPYEQKAVETFVSNTCGDDQTACLEACSDEFWRDEAATHWAVCSDIVATKFRSGS